MKIEAQRFHLDVVSEHAISLFNDLINKHNVHSGLKEMNFIDKYEMEIAEKGFFAKKEFKEVERKYFIKNADRYNMPFKVKAFDEVKLKTAGGYDIVMIPNTITPFKINPEQMMNPRILIDTLAPFENSNQDEYTLLKIVAITGFCAKIFIVNSSIPEFGKSSIYELLHYLTDKSPVFKPRSIPGVLHHITESGNMVFDEISKKQEVKDIMEEFSLMIGGGKNQYINGAKKASGMKQTYDCSNQSITYLANEFQHYSNPEKEFFDYCFTNNPAMDSRFLKLKFTGKMTERFDKEFNIKQVAEDNKMLYINITKTLLWLSDVYKENKYDRRYKTNSPVAISLNGRRLQNYESITLLIDMYCVDQVEYDKFVKVLDNSIINYKTMLPIKQEVDYTNGRLL